MSALKLTQEFGSHSLEKDYGVVRWTAEYTDTGGGEASYSWVRRAEFNAPNGASQREVMRRAKAALDLTGTRGVTHTMGEGYEFRPYGSATVLFVS